MSKSSPSSLRLSIVAVALSALCAVQQPALAGSLVDAATKAEALAASNDTIGAHDVMREAISDFSASLPFTLGKAVFVTAEPVGYAMYSPKETPTFAKGEKLVSYVEPIGLNWKEASEKGKLESHFTVDFELLNPAGEVLTGQKAFGDFTFTSFFRNQEVYATLTINLTGAEAGDYKIRFHFNDLNSGKSASVDQAFSITE